jgi:outer membrane protein assembly factor BamA
MGGTGVILLVLTLALPLSAAGAAAPEIQVEGSKRTKPAHIRYLARECFEEQVAQTVTDLDLPELEQCLMNSELFTEVRVTVGRNEDFSGNFIAFQIGFGQ